MTEIYIISNELFLEKYKKGYALFYLFVLEIRKILCTFAIFLVFAEIIGNE